MEEDMVLWEDMASWEELVTAWLWLLLWLWLVLWCTPWQDPGGMQWLTLWPMLSATMTWLRSPPTPTSMVWLMSTLALPSSRPRLTMELASGRDTTQSTCLTEGSSTSTTTPATSTDMLPRSPTTALLPTLMSLSESATVLSAMPSPDPLLSPIPLLSLVPLLSPIPLLSLIPLLSHLTAALVMVVPSSDK